MRVRSGSYAPMIYRPLEEDQMLVIRLALLPLAILFATLSVEAANSGAERALRKKLVLPEPVREYVAIKLPAHFHSNLRRRYDNTPNDNPLTNAGATLGRALFHDPLLSANGAISCASCHEQDRAFADRRRRSRGVHGRKGRRNALSLVNLRYHPTDRFFWDERASSIEEQVLLPIQDPQEMAMPLHGLPERVRLRSEYPALFKAAFGSESITTLRIAQALAQFMRALVSYRSKYDFGLARVESVDHAFPNFTKQENEGKALFFGRARCASCHVADAPRGRRGRFARGGRRGGRTTDKPALFVGRFPTNNGLDKTARTSDLGRSEISGDEEDDGVFKAPSLRNVAVTGPYMHDGRMASLAAVIEHYNREVEPHPNLDGRLQGRRGETPRRLNLSSRERRALVTFLKTLTDESFLKDPRFSDPFR